MKSPFLKTYLAVAVLAGLGAYAYFVESKKPAGTDTKPKEKALVFGKPKVKELTLAPFGGEKIRLVKEGSGWKLTEPTSVPADSNEADSLLTSLENLEIDEVVSDSPGNLGQFGLESPKNSVSVVLEGAKDPLTLLIGEKTPDGGALYAKLPAQPRVFTIASHLEPSFNKKPFDLRDRDLLHVKRDAVKGLEVSGLEETYALARDDKGEWAFTRPLATKAGRWSVDGLLGTLENLKMESVAADDATDLKPFGLAKPVRTVKLTLADGGYKILEIGSPAGEKKHHAREANASLVAIVPGAIVDDLAKGMKELRQKRLSDIATYEVEAVELLDEGKKTVLARSTGKDKDGVETQSWKRTLPAKKDLDRAKVDDALFKLSGLEVQEFVDKPQPPASYGLDAPAVKVALKMTAGKPGVNLELGRKDGSVFARRPGDEAVLKLDAAKVDEALKAFKEL